MSVGSPRLNWAPEGQELKYLFTLVLSALLQGLHIGSSVTPRLVPVTWHFF